VSTDRGSVLLTGATGRIGSVLARGFAQQGWNLALSCRDLARAQALEQECRQRGAGSVVLLPSDLAAGDAVMHLLSQLAAARFQPTVLINNTRDRAHLETRADGTIADEHFMGELRLGVVVPYELTNALASAPSATLRSVVNISSIYGMNVPQLRLYERSQDAPPPSYGVAKAALLHLTRELAVRMAPRIRVNAVSFGGVAGRASDAFTTRYEAATPMGAMLEDGDLFGAVSFLAGDAAGAVTGHNLVVDGGWTLW
jgi:NAD(P)-dependent dehydrogenase (short-subunit alcohol dehydrogenase family)